MFKKKYLGLAIAATLAAGSAQAFNAESFTVSGYVKNETAALTKDGTFNGQETSATDTTTHNSSGDIIKSESSVKLFVNGDVSEGSSMHAELLLHNDSKAKGSHFKNSDSYTQSEFLRELYIDTSANDWDLRLGKQQVVWGTADGAKFMDMINPTDYREMAQNVMAESRIPVWMLSAEKYLENGANIQFVISQPKQNTFAGLNDDINQSNRSNADLTAGGAATLAYGGAVTGIGHDQGNPFILKGVDTITGQTNGFVNIVPDLGTVAALFGRAFSLNGQSKVGGLNAATHANSATIGFTVGAFNSGTTLAGFGAAFDAANGAGGDFTTLNFGNNAGFYGGGVPTGQQALGGFAAMFPSSNLLNTDAAINSTFEYMDRTSFGTFDAFAYATSEYKIVEPDDADTNLAFRFKDTTSNGTNYSLAYSYNYDPNPVIDVSWRDQAGNKLTVNRGAAFNTGDRFTSVLTLSGGSQAAYGGKAIDDATGTAAILRFEQTLERVHNLGASADFAIETDSFGPVVIRTEGVYTKDARTPVIDRGALSIGDLPAALKMLKGDKFKYVIGADVSVLTDMMMSAQFIQERNLDFIDNPDQDFDGSSCSAAGRVAVAANCGVYTADFASMHLTNGLKKGIENKEFYSLFLSKPFGASGEGRWNNILMLEEGGGRWNRFDVEYSITNDLIGTVEYNKYWGDDNSQFGQLEAASNIQLGLKYLFE